MNFNEKLPQFWRIWAFKNMLKLKTVTERGDNGNRYFDNTFSFSNEFRSVRPYFITLRDDLLITQQYVYTCGNNGYQFRTAFSVCLTLKAFICRRKSQIMLRENTGGNAAKGCQQKSTKSKKFSRVMASTDSHGIVKIPACLPGGLE